MSTSRVCGVVAFVLLAVSVPSGLSAQDVDKQVADVLGRIPARNTAEKDQLKQALAALGQTGIERLCGMVVEPGTGDDTNVRMALHAITFLAAEPTAKKTRKDYMAAISNVLASDAAPGAKEFLIQQLQLVGGPDVVPVLAPSLADPSLCKPAVEALLAIEGDAARTALRKALRGATGEIRVPIMDALGTLRDAESVKPLLADARSDDAAVRRAALWALADIGDPTAADVLLAAMNVEAWQEQADATAAVLRFASRLTTGGHPNEAVKLLRGLAQSEFAHVHAAALSGLAEALGPKAIDDLVAALTSDNPEIRSAAVEIVAALPGPGVTQACVERLKQAPAPAKAGILTALARRGDPAALPAASDALSDSDKAVRLAAVTAAAGMGKDEAIQPLVKFLNTAEEDERKTAQAALVRMAGEAVSKKIADSIGKASPSGRIALIQVLSERGAAGQLDTVFAATKDADESVRITAIQAVGTLGDSAATPKLLALLLASRTPAEREAVELSLSAVCKRGKTPAEAAAPILAAIQPADPAVYGSLLRVLGKIGGKEAMQAVREATGNPQDIVREAAFAALAEWPDTDAADDVLDIARGEKPLNYHVLAMRAYVRLVAMDGKRPAEKTVAMCRAGIETARRPEEKRLVLSRLGEIRDPRALPLLESYLADETLGDDAAAAMVSVADKLLPEGWQESRKALEKALGATKAEPVRQRAAEVMKRVTDMEDFVTDWQVAGPFTQQENRDVP